MCPRAAKGQVHNLSAPFTQQHGWGPISTACAGYGATVAGDGDAAATARAGNARGGAGAVVGDGASDTCWRGGGGGRIARECLAKRVGNYDRAGDNSDGDLGTGARRTRILSQIKSKTW